MTTRKRIYIPPIMQAQLDELRSQPGYADSTDSTLLEVIADRAVRGGAVLAATPAAADVASNNQADTLDIELDF